VYIIFSRTNGYENTSTFEQREALRCKILSTKKCEKVE